MLLRMGGAVEDQLRHATEALLASDHAKARHAIALDEDIDRLELQIDEVSIQLLALHQPAAADLRFIVAAINRGRDRARAHRRPGGQHRALRPRADASRRTPGPGARSHGGALDQLEREIVQRLTRLATRDPEHLQSVFRLGYVARCLERVGDHATNVAEMVLYIAHATVARHRSILAAAATDKGACHAL